MTRRIGSPNEVTTTAARDVASGDLHECPDGRAGVYMGAQTVLSGGKLVLSTCERLEVVAVAFVEAAAGAVANFNFTTQTLVASGQTDVGRYLETKAANALTATVLLNDPGPSA